MIGFSWSCFSRKMIRYLYIVSEVWWSEIVSKARQEMEETGGNSMQPEGDTSLYRWLPPSLVDKMQSIDLCSQEEISSVGVSGCSQEEDFSPQTVSQMLWENGQLNCRIPNGFYSVIPDKTVKARFSRIPSLEELCSLAAEGFKADAVIVDAEKDKRLAKLKQFTVASVKGLSSNPASMIKKIADVVCEFYGGPLSEASPVKISPEEISTLADSHGFQLLGQIKNGLCRPRAILFKVLADAVGLKSKLLVGLQLYDKAIAYKESPKHMSLLVELNSVDMLVDIMRSPGQLIPFSVRALIIYHISGSGESDSAENDSCDSPLEPNSPNFGFPDKLEGESPEHPLLRTHGRSMLSGRRQSFGEDGDSVSASSPDQSPQHNIAIRKTLAMPGQRLVSSPLTGGNERRRVATHGTWVGGDFTRSDHHSPSEARRIRKRSISVTPEIGDDIVRAVRAMKEAMKQEQLVKSEEGAIGDEKSQTVWNNQSEHALNFVASDEGSSSRERTESSYSKDPEKHSHRAISVPSSPREFQKNLVSVRGMDHSKSVDIITSWNRVLESSPLTSKPLLPFLEWNIDFSELRVGVRVGIGSFGEVFRGIWKGTEVAIKILLEQDLTEENMEDFCNEISLLSRLRHPNVILFLGACTKPPHLSMVTEYMEMGSLYHLIHTSGQGKKFSWRRRLKMLRDICRGMMCIQRMNIVHRDLKSANCLVDKHLTVKICDFGLSRIMTNLPIRDTVAAGTPEWMAPELLRNEPFTYKCDIFSLGVIMWELCTLKRPWEAVQPMQVVYAVAHEGARLDIPEGPIGKLISDCWADADDRPSYEEIFTRLHECEFLIS
ncbi:serine/threonine-protein kinase EDR1 isoform X4 [Cryptomeria japonica]|uniref:serine/threonine-protein kinase EDR1 isoform X4 n=1 Tax=Cryptomeria japonica TaxID=3369 RepID=UPI0025ABE152|nr:serine/threonine-protein kinase EDR1 isoform X4 [Cryptomeria japonica]